MDHENNEFVDLPHDPEMAFAILQQRKYADLERRLANDENSAGWRHEERYFDTLIAFDEVHNLGILTAYRREPNKSENFNQFFNDFCRYVEMASAKIRMEDARRIKTGAQTIIVLDATARQAIHALINAIREKLNELTLPETKREALFNKLNAFAAEVDRNRTRTEAFLSLAVDVVRAGKEIKDGLKSLQQPIDRVLDLIEKANKWTDALPPWKDRKRIEGPPKRLAPPQQDLDDEIPF